MEDAKTAQADGQQQRGVMALLRERLATHRKARDQAEEQGRHMAHQYHGGAAHALAAVLGDLEDESAS